MFHRVVVDVIDMAGEIGIVADDVLPETAAARVHIHRGDCVQTDTALSNNRVKRALMARHRPEKFSSPSGSVQRVCK